MIDPKQKVYISIMHPKLRKLYYIMKGQVKIKHQPKLKSNFVNCQPMKVKRNSWTSVDTKSLRCANCYTLSTPLWRKANDKIVCNACGIYWRSKGYHKYPTTKGYDHRIISIKLLQ